jgi:hypothetical protein
MHAGFLLIDTTLSIAVAMAVTTQYAPAGDPIVEAIVGMPGLTEESGGTDATTASPTNIASGTSTTSKTSTTKSPSSVVINEICPLVVDLYQKEMQKSRQTEDDEDVNNDDAAPILTPLANPQPQTYHVDALQRFVRNCQRRQRVEQTMAWQLQQYNRSMP